MSGAGGTAVSAEPPPPGELFATYGHGGRPSRRLSLPDGRAAASFSGEFQSQLDDPHYRPQDRLLVRRANQLIGHARIVRRLIRFGPASLPIALFVRYGHVARVSGTGLRQSRCCVPPNSAWRPRAPCWLFSARVHPSFSNAADGAWRPDTASPSRGLAEILALLRERAAQRPSLLAPTLVPITIRLWRQVERDALVRSVRTKCDGQLRSNDAQ